MPRGSGWGYRYDAETRPVERREAAIRFRRPDGGMGERRFATWRTHHGPITAARDGRCIATALMWRPIPALEQSWLRTQAIDLASYLQVAERKANSSNDTLFADDRGEIAFLMPQFMPVRDDRFDYTRPVDGSDPATDWTGLHALATLPSVADPRVGWVHNTNDWPWSAAGPDSPKAADYPRYMDQVGGNARGERADVVVVEFGYRVKASAVMAGGQSGDPASPHFDDQIDPYAIGRLRPVYVYPDKLAGHVERVYRPGER